MIKKRTIRKTGVLIPDGEWEILANHVLHCLASTGEISVYIMSNKPNRPSKYSRYVTHYTYIPKTEKVANWIAQINAEVRRHSIDFIMPVYEDAIRHLLEHIELLEIPDKLVPLPTYASFITASNKLKLADHLRMHSIPAPKIFELNAQDRAPFEGLQYPIIAKPIIQSEGGGGIRLFRDEPSLIKYLEDPTCETLFYQEFIQGYDIDCSVLCRNGEICAYTIQKGMIYGRKAFTAAIGLQFLEEERLLQVVQKLMKSLTWNGVAHIDLRYDSNDSTFKVIEVNSRFWYSLDASWAVGVNFPYLYVKLARSERFAAPAYQNLTYLTLKGLVAVSRKKPQILLNLPYLWKQTALRQALKDPFPQLVKFWSRRFIPNKSDNV